MKLTPPGSMSLLLFPAWFHCFVTLSSRNQQKEPSSHQSKQQSPAQPPPSPFYIPSPPPGQVEGPHIPGIAKSREFATFGGCGWQLWSKSKFPQTPEKLNFRNLQLLGIVVGSCGLGYPGSHNTRIAKSRKFAAFAGCGWQLWSRGCTGLLFLTHLLPGAVDNFMCVQNTR